jgi:hypothetical protein
VRVAAADQHHILEHGMARSFHAGPNRSSSRPSRERGESRNHRQRISIPVRGFRPAHRNDA